MYELNYVKKRKRRKWVAIGGGISSVVVATLGIVSFLGRFVGTFTVRLETGDVKLALSESHDFAQQSTYLRIDQLPPFQEYTYASLLDIGHGALDNEQSSYANPPAANLDKDGQSVRSVNYFKYTFFVKNVGLTPAYYDMKVNILDSKADGGTRFEDTLRVMIYQNDPEADTHDNEVYARRSYSNHYDEQENVSFDERISTSEYGYAKQFETDNVITTLSVEQFLPGDELRYTIVFWLEGFDPQSNRMTEIPLNARLKLGVEINAYEI
jgi:hypothetical protein